MRMNPIILNHAKSETSDKYLCTVQIYTSLPRDYSRVRAVFCYHTSKAGYNMLTSARRKAALPGGCQLVVESEETAGNCNLLP